MTSTDKPFAPAAERNRHAILPLLKNALSPGELVLEFGSGTGQHVCHFAAHMPDVRWLPTDRAENLPGICQWIDESRCPNILSPQVLDLNRPSPAAKGVTSCYSANTLHIISWPLVEALFTTAATLLSKGGKLMVYGPVRIGGDYGTEGNQRFDQLLRSGDPSSGLRDTRDLDLLAQNQGFSAASIQVMPAGNHLLTWDRQPVTRPG